MTGPTVSVVVCGYNQVSYVEGAVASVLSQTYPHLDVIVVDNGSTDGSRDRLQKFGSDPRVQLILHEQNAAITTRLNQAIAMAQGEFVSILYADDYYLPHKLERQVAEFATLPRDYGVVYGPSYRLDEETGARWTDQSLRRSGAVLQDMFRLHYVEGFVNPISPLIRRECFERYPFDEEVFVEGESIFLRLALTYRFQYVDEPLVVMREHASNLGKAIKRNAAVALFLLDKLVEDPDFPPALRPDLEFFRSNFIGSCGWLAIRMAADPRWARGCLISAVQRQPRQLLRLRTLAGLALSLLPAAAVRFVNRGLNAIGGHRETIAYLADYR